MQSPSTTDMETFADIQTFEDITMKGKSIYTRAILERAAQHFDKSISLVQRLRPMFVNHIMGNGTFVKPRQNVITGSLMWHQSYVSLAPQFTGYI
jgi:hypothetical protein